MYAPAPPCAVTVNWTERGATPDWGLALHCALNAPGAGVGVGTGAGVGAGVGVGAGFGPGVGLGVGPGQAEPGRWAAASATAPHHPDS